MFEIYTRVQLRDANWALLVEWNTYLVPSFINDLYSNRMYCFLICQSLHKLGSLDGSEEEYQVERQSRSVSRELPFCNMFVMRVNSEY